MSSSMRRRVMLMMSVLLEIKCVVEIIVSTVYMFAFVSVCVCV